MPAFRTYEYRIFPTDAQRVALDLLFQKADNAFNELVPYATEQAVLNERNEAKKNVDAFVFSATDITRSTQRDIKRRMVTLMDKMFARKIPCIYPCSRNRARRKYYYSSAELYDQSILLPDVGTVAMEQHRKLPPDATVYTVGVFADNYGAQYRVSLLMQMAEPAPLTAPVRYDKVLGLDYAQDGLYIDSKGNCGDYPGFRHMAQEELARHRAAALRFKPGSARWKKHRQRAEKLEQHIRNQRKDWQYKKAHELTQQYDAVCVETLNMQKMMQQNPKLTGKMCDNAGASFNKKLETVLAQNGKQLVFVPQYYPSTQICSVCGKQVGKLPLDTRTLVCPQCGTQIDRDINAARNIREYGLRVLCTEDIRPGSSGLNAREQAA